MFELPKVTGYYWLRCTYDSALPGWTKPEWVIVHLDLEDQVIRYMGTDEEEWTESFPDEFKRSRIVKAEWRGPIEVPKEEERAESHAMSG